MEGTKTREQREEKNRGSGRWSSTYARDAWRNFNPDTVATTWASREGKKVRKRTDRVLIDERLIEKTTETTINKTIISDHDVITWTIETRREKMKNPYDRITTDSIEDVDYQNEVRKIYEEERGGGMTGYERFKKKKNDRIKLNRQIELIRQRILWTENAIIQQEKGR